MEVGGTIPWMESVDCVWNKQSRVIQKQLHRGTVAV